MTSSARSSLNALSLTVVDSGHYMENVGMWGEEVCGQGPSFGLFVPWFGDWRMEVAQNVRVWPWWTSGSVSKGVVFPQYVSSLVSNPFSSSAPVLALPSPHWADRERERTAEPNPLWMKPPGPLTSGFVQPGQKKARLGWQQAWDPGRRGRVLAKFGTENVWTGMKLKGNSCAEERRVMWIKRVHGDVWHSSSEWRTKESDRTGLKKSLV